MPLLQESTPKRDVLSIREVKVEPDETNTLKNPLTSVGYPAFPTSGMFTPSQLIMASQLMAASGLTLPANSAFFHPSLLPLAWPPNSPPSPPNSTEQLSPPLKARKFNVNNYNNNNNIVTSSSNELKFSKRKPWKDEEMSMPSPTSSSSPPSSTDISSKEVNRDKQFTCGVCHRSFGYKHVLQNHERTHTGEKPFECPECHKRFTRDHHLKTHMRLHTGERPYHCEHCDRQFVQVANLRRHLRVHTGERPYACEHCSAKFSDSNQLKAHLLIHTNEKPFSCDRCHSRFRRRHHLLHHKCDAPPQKEMTPESDEYESAKMLRMRIPTTPPIVSLPLHITLPEQTEPEDLSMTTGIQSHSAGSSPLLKSSSRDGMDEDEYESQHSTAIFSQRKS